MGDISKNFSRREFKCGCCDFSTADAVLVDVLEYGRENFGPCKVISGARCAHHNGSVGGEKNSYHLVGRAADVRFKTGTGCIKSKYNSLRNRRLNKP